MRFLLEHWNRICKGRNNIPYLQTSLPSNMVRQFSHRYLADQLRGVGVSVSPQPLPTEIYLDEETLYYGNEAQRNTTRRTKYISWFILIFIMFSIIKRLSIINVYPLSHMSLTAELHSFNVIVGTVYKLSVKCSLFYL